MAIDLEKSIKYIFNDKDWKKKTLIGAAFFIPNAIFSLVSFFSDSFKGLNNAQMSIVASILFVLAVIFSISSIYISGYLAKNTNIRIIRPNADLLEWKNFGEMFFVGFKASIAIFIYIFIMFISLLGEFIIFYILFGGSKAGIIPAAILLIPFTFLFIFIMALGTLSFYTDLRFSSYFNFKRMARLIKGNIGQFIIYLIIIGAIAVFNSTCVNILTLLVVGVVLIPFLYIITSLIVSDVAAQFIRSALKIDSREKIETPQ